MCFLYNSLSSPRVFLRRAWYCSVGAELDRIAQYHSSRTSRWCICQQCPGPYVTVHPHKLSLPPATNRLYTPFISHISIMQHFAALEKPVGRRERAQATAAVHLAKLVAEIDSFFRRPNRKKVSYMIVAG
jgi:hypothetical protein